MFIPLRSRLARLGLAALAAGTSVAAVAAHYTLVDLGADKYPAQVNGRDMVAGSSRGDHAIVWRGSHWRQLSHGQSAGRAINASGDVAGDVRSLPVLWPHGEARQNLPLPGNSLFGLGRGINAQREVVGLFYGTGKIRCFAWTPAGGSIDLGFMDQGDECQAFDVNASGQITGMATTAASGGKSHAFRYQDGKFEDLGILAGGDQSQGISINRHGDVAGRASVPPLDDMHFHAVAWTHGHLIDLDPDSVSDESVATGINNGGEIVGTITLNGVFDTRAVRYTARGVVVLQDEVRNLAGWMLSQAEGINDDGVIVGSGYAADGSEHGFMLVPDGAD